jgi:hypothetical protein
MSRLLILLVLAWAAQPSRPLPQADSFFAAARENLVRATREQNRYAYKERRAELHMNPFGRLGAGEIRLYEVTPGPEPSVYFRRLLERDGTPVPDSKPERQQRRNRSSGPSGIDDTVATLDFAIQRRESANGRDLIVVGFEPRPNARPQTREGRMAKIFKGLIWVDEELREVVRVEATAIDDLSYGFGIIARLNKGTVVSLVRAPVGDGIWLPVSMRFKGDGRALMVRKLSIDLSIDWFDYKRVR